MDLDDALLDETADRFEAVLAGTQTRFEAHAWAEAMMFAEDSDTYAQPVTMGMQYLHAMTLVETRPGRTEHREVIDHWQEWVTSDADMRAAFAAWRRHVETYRAEAKGDAKGEAGTSVASPEMWMEIDEIGRDVLGEDEPDR